MSNAVPHVRTKAPVIAYVVTIVAFYLASFATDERLWGINWWGFLPDWTHLTLAVVGFIAGFAVVYLTARNRESDIATRTFVAVSILVTLVFGAAFVVLRVESHFLGDGYQLLSELSQPQPVIKPTNLGGTYPQLWLSTVLKDWTVLTTYHIVAVAAGLLCVVITFLLGRRLYDNHMTTLQAVAVLITGGYTLQFFGYVENYAMFLVTVMGFALTGMLVGEGKVNQWWLIPLILLGIIFHIFGIFLIPAALYLFARQTAVGRWLRRLPFTGRVLTATVISFVVIILYVYIRSQSLYFQLAFLRLQPGQFTVDGYTLFSVKHVLDFANLFLLLLPGIAVMIAGIPYRRLSTYWRQPDIRFLSILAFTSLAAAFFIDPKLGMPRDWDLLAFCGIPVMVLLTHLLLQTSRHRHHKTSIVSLVVLLNLMMLGSRMSVLNSEGATVKMMSAYIELDPIRNRPAFTPLQEYLIEHDMIDRAVQSRRLHDRLYPEKQMEKQADRLLMKGDARGARLLIHRVLERNPIMWTTHNMLGRVYLAEGKYDSAARYFSISDALNPYNPQVTANLGLVYEMMRQLDEARMLYERALGYDSMTVDANFGLMRLSLATGATAQAQRYLNRMGRIDALSPDYFLRTAETALARGAIGIARQALRYGLQRGLDTAVVRRMQAQYPQLNVLPADSAQ